MHKGFSRWSFVIKAFFSSFAAMPWQVDGGDETVQEAVRLVKANARTIKRMLLLGIIFHGEKVVEMEFFLRRVTTLSLYAFGILSVLAKISGDLKSGVPKSGDINLLRYFLEEAKEARCNSTRIFDTEKEKLGAAVFHDLETIS
jgi:acyl-CoA dehydrogenase family protein 9